MESKKVFVVFYQDAQDQSHSVLVMAKDIIEASKKFEEYALGIDERIECVTAIENKTPHYQAILF